MRTLAALALLSALALSGCSDDAKDAVDNAKDTVKDTVSSAAAEADLPDVDWDKYGDQLRTKIDDLAENADCESLKAELNDHGKLDTDVVAYIKAKLEEAGC